MSPSADRNIPGLDFSPVFDHEMRLRGPLRTAGTRHRTVRRRLPDGSLFQQFRMRRGYGTVVRQRQCSRQDRFLAAIDEEKGSAKSDAIQILPAVWIVASTPPGFRNYPFALRPLQSDLLPQPDRGGRGDSGGKGQHSAGQKNRVLRGRLVHTVRLCRVGRGCAPGGRSRNEGRNRTGGRSRSGF